ncbi:MAG: hypothetical protein L3J97_07680, partial [Thermoplasmata archaeon]|nr:hypothetical protein [Thermoplasmata archaeon]
MTTRLFPTQEIGSLMKPRWQLLGQRGEPLDTAAQTDFARWNDALHFVPGDDPMVRKFLGDQSREVGAETVRDWAALFMLRYFESAGLDRV